MTSPLFSRSLIGVNQGLIAINGELQWKLPLVLCVWCDLWLIALHKGENELFPLFLELILTAAAQTKHSAAARSAGLSRLIDSLFDRNRLIVTAFISLPIWWFCVWVKIIKIVVGMFSPLFWTCWTLDVKKYTEKLKKNCIHWWLEWKCYSKACVKFRTALSLSEYFTNAWLLVNSL